MRKAFIITVATLVASLASADEKPLWDLARDKIQADLKLGKIEKVDNKVTLKDGAAFAVPAKAFPDQKNFTVQVTAEILELVDHTLFTVMSKQSSDKDDGFTVTMNYREKPYYARHIGWIVNKIFMRSGGIGGKRGPKINTPYTFTIAVRDGELDKHFHWCQELNLYQQLAHPWSGLFLPHWNKILKLY